ncbi:MAG: choice-of-anchor D domain-containing protein, partial [Aeromicrobium sp.]|nr:choice-of-anchor D domain-containing protein [Burkholderiales bacterium]
MNTSARSVFDEVVSGGADCSGPIAAPMSLQRGAQRKSRAAMRAATAVMALGLVASALTSLTPAFAQTTLTVTNNLDYGGPAVSGTLRQVLEYQAINCYGPFSPFTINFIIFGAGPHTIQPSVALPAVSCANTVIDGYSQSGATANTTGVNVNTATPSGNDANIKIILNGTIAGASRGLTITGDLVTVKGLAIRSFQQEGIFITGNSARIYGNYIGTDPGGMTAYGNGFAGIKLAGGSGTYIGAGGAANTNLITGNTLASIQVFAPATAFRVWFNMLGGNRSGGNTVTGGGNGALEILANPCGAPVAMGADVYGNRIQFNAGSGVFVDGCATNNLISENGIAANGAKAINTNATGNSSLQKPTITAVEYTATKTKVIGTFNPVLDSFHRIDLYGNTTAPTVAESQFYVPSSTYSANAIDTSPGKPFDIFNLSIVPNPSVTLTRNTIGTSELSDVYRTPFSFTPGTGVNSILPTFTAFSATAGGATQFQTISVTNTSGASLAFGLTPVTLTGATFSVGAPANACAGQTIGNGASCNIQVGFTSGTSGTFTGTANLTVTQGGVTSSSQVPLTGTAVAPAATGLSLSSNALNFGNVIQGQVASPNQTITVTNTGANPLVISSIPLSGGSPSDYSITDTCRGNSIPPPPTANTCTITLGFTALGIGSR